MELGEVICIPNGEPNCLKCPAAAHCRAHSSQTVSQYPVKSAKKSRKIEQHTILLLSCRGKYAIHRRKNQGLLAGLWEFPNFNFYAAPADIEMYLHSLKTKALSCAPCGEAKHIFSHVEWHMRGYAVECSEETQSFLWKSPEEIKTSYAIPSAFRFYLGLL